MSNAVIKKEVQWVIQNLKQKRDKSIETTHPNVITCGDRVCVFIDGDPRMTYQLFPAQLTKAQTAHVKTILEDKYLDLGPFVVENAYEYYEKRLKEYESILETFS